MDNWSEASRFAIELFTITAPFACLPMFIGMTERMSMRGRIMTATASVLTMIVILLITQYVGSVVITALGTTLPSFQIAGGLIIAMAEFGMLRGGAGGSAGTEGHGDTEAVKVGVVPLGIPLMAGPGTITAVVLESQHDHGDNGSLIVSIIIIGVAALMWVIYMLAVPIRRCLGQIGLNVVTQVFGLVLTAIGVEIIVRGIQTHVTSFMSLN